MRPLLILRPEPGASATGTRAKAIGLDPIVSPLFTIAPLEWEAPDPAGFDAVMMTSANAARLAGPQLTRYRHLPLYAVGEATAHAAWEAGFGRIVTGTGDAHALAAQIAHGPHERLLWLSGSRRTPMPGVMAQAIAVYEASAVEALPQPALSAAGHGAVAMLHSPRAASVFASLIDRAAVPRADISLAAISAPAAEAAGVGWGAVAIATAPNDAAMLAIARALCDNVGP